VFSTARLIIEPLTVQHADQMFAGLSDTAGYVFLPEDPPLSIDILRERYRKLSTSPGSPDGKETWHNWIIKKNDSLAAVGYLQATHIVQNNTALVSYFIFPEFWKLGFGYEAVSWLVGHLFFELEVQKLLALVDTRNVSSINLLSKIGFRKRRLIPDVDFFKGHSSDEFEFVMSKPLRSSD
jgi:ribosomal-protein-alanine N-acetyltransferase